MSKLKKSGPLTESERTFISINAKDKSPEWIAEELGRNVDTITKIISQSDLYGNSKSDILNLEKREDWKIIKEQFSESELNLFRERWVGLVNQFREELKYSEAMMLINAIKQDILANRILLDERHIINEIERLEEERRDEMEQDPPNTDRIKSIEFTISSYCAAQSANNKSYIESVDKLEKSIKLLRGTREQRLSKAEESQKSFSTWMRMLLEDVNTKRELGNYMSKMQLATQREQERLGGLHQFANGEFDRPFLNCDTVFMEE